MEVYCIARNSSDTASVPAIQNSFCPESFSHYACSISLICICRQPFPCGAGEQARPVGGPLPGHRVNHRAGPSTHDGPRPPRGPSERRPQGLSGAERLTRCQAAAGRAPPHRHRPPQGQKSPRRLLGEHLHPRPTPCGHPQGGHGSSAMGPAGENRRHGEACPRHPVRPRGEHRGPQGLCAERRKLEGVPHARFRGRSPPGRAAAGGQRGKEGGRQGRGCEAGKASPTRSFAAALPHSRLLFCPGGSAGPAEQGITPRPVVPPAPPGPSRPVPSALPAANGARASPHRARRSPARRHL